MKKMRYYMKKLWEKADLLVIAGSYSMIAMVGVLGVVVTH